MRWRRAALALNGTVGVRRSWEGPAPYPTRPPEASRADPCTTVQARAPGPQLARSRQGGLLALVLDEPAVLYPPPERALAAEEPRTHPLVALHVRDALADAVALRLGERGDDGHEQLPVPVSHVAAHVEQVERHAALAEPLHHLEGIEGRPERPVELGGDHRVAGLQGGHQLAAGRALGQGHAAAHALLDEHPLDAEPLHKGVALDLPALHVEAQALLGLPRGGHPDVPVHRHDRPFRLSATARLSQRLALSSCLSASTK